MNVADDEGIGLLRGAARPSLLVLRGLRSLCGALPDKPLADAFSDEVGEPKSSSGIIRSVVYNFWPGSPNAPSHLWTLKHSVDHLARGIGKWER